MIFSIVSQFTIEKELELDPPRSHREKSHVVEIVDLTCDHVDPLKVYIRVVGSVLEVEEKFNGIIFTVPFDPEAKRQSLIIRIPGLERMLPVHDCLVRSFRCFHIKRNIRVTPGPGCPESE